MSSTKLVLAILVFVTFGENGRCDAARILGVFPLPGKSHFMMGEVLMKGLAARGHQVDVLSHFPQKNPPPNYRDISLVGTLPSSVNNLTLNDVKDFGNSNLQKMFHLAGKEICKLLSLPQFGEIIQNPPNDPPYDLVIVEIMTADCFLALGRHLNVPVVGVVVARLFDWLNKPLGNPQNAAFVPSCFSEYSQRMTYVERLQNFVLTTYVKTEYTNAVHSQLMDVWENFYLRLGSTSELYKDVAVVLVNTHPSFDGVRPMTPGIVEVGGLHVVDGHQNLTSEVQSWLDDSKDGFVYFSFGSMVKFESFPIETIKAFFEAFEYIAPVRVLMKIAKKDELPLDLPKNVMTSPWLPQTRVLKHKNVKAFVTHGGMMSTQEAITYGVPMIGVPIFADQHLNVRLSEEKKISVTVPYRQVTSDAIKQAFDDVLYNPIYRESSQNLAKLYLDRPMSALDTAIFWVEYAIRNGNALRSPAADLQWYQLELLDLWVFIIAVGLLVFYVTKRFIPRWSRFLYSKIKTYLGSAYALLHSMIKKQEISQKSQVALKTKKNK